MEVLAGEAKQYCFDLTSPSSSLHSASLPPILVVDNTLRSRSNALPSSRSSRPSASPAGTELTLDFDLATTVQTERSSGVRADLTTVRTLLALGRGESVFLFYPHPRCIPGRSFAVVFHAYVYRFITFIIHAFPSEAFSNSSSAMFQ
ncbi:hypothetical protein MVEN_00130500 [Mycena venus]|uniref:Uncharacterized protein n=1 Tax=Mycena venus TaxID=2733690 RepID=A0A8H7DGV5_9AGAR|nr:hypothetical protein MVEN_00130500 [Mycena venus]